MAIWKPTYDNMRSDCRCCGTELPWWTQEMVDGVCKWCSNAIWELICSTVYRPGAAPREGA